MNKVLSTSLCKGIADWFSNNTYFVSNFDNTTKLFISVGDYYRIDIPQSEMNSVYIYPLTSDTITKPSKEIGKIGISINFNLSKTREFRSQLIYSTIESVRSQLLSNPIYIQQFLSKNYVPGLQLINGQNKTDYTKLNKQISTGNGSATAIYELSYQIDILLNQRALWKTGNDFYSPNTIIYNNINTIEITTTIGNTPDMIGYYVTPSENYSTTGTVIIPNNYTGKGLFIGNNGTVTDTLLILKNNIKNPEYFYVDTINSVYLSTGMLILSKDAISGNGGILLGDDGIVYRLIYDGTLFSPIFYGTTTVFAANGYIVNGTLLTKIDVNINNAGILFGEDNNVYDAIYLNS